MMMMLALFFLCIVLLCVQSYASNSASSFELNSFLSAMLQIPPSPDFLSERKSHDFDRGSLRIVGLEKVAEALADIGAQKKE